MPRILAGLVLLCAAVSSVPALANAVLPTAASWNDQVSASLPLAAGQWEQQPSANSCTAYGYDGAALENCVVTGIRVEGWGVPGSRMRNYYVTFDAPGGARTVSFDIDLNVEQDPSAAPWSWETSGIVSGAQFAAASGWSCSALPRVQGLGADWHYPAIFFQVSEDRRGASTLCE